MSGITVSMVTVLLKVNVLGSVGDTVSMVSESLILNVLELPVKVTEPSVIMSATLKNALSEGLETLITGAPPLGVKVLINLLPASSVISTAKESLVALVAEKLTLTFGSIMRVSEPTLTLTTLVPVPRAVAVRTNSSLSLVSILKVTSGITVSTVTVRVAVEDLNNLSFAK